VHIPVGADAEIEFSVVAQRSDPVSYVRISGTYHVQVTNTGCEATSDLRVVTMLQGLDGEGVWQDLEEIEVAYSTVIQPGETATYQAPVDFYDYTGNYSDYRAVTSTTIDNYVGHIGQRYGDVNYDGLETITVNEPVVIDEDAWLTDLGLDLPDGYAYTAESYLGPIYLDSTELHIFTFIVENVNATEDGNVVNSVILRTGSGANETASSNVTVVDPGPPGPAMGELTISKIADGPQDQAFVFEVDVNGDPYVGEYAVGEDTFSTDDGTITLKGGESAVILLEENSSVQVEERPVEGWVLRSSDVNGKVLEGEDAELRSLLTKAEGDSVTFRNSEVEDLVLEVRVYGTNTPKIGYRFTLLVDGEPYVGNYTFTAWNGNDTRYTDDGVIKAYFEYFTGDSFVFQIPAGSLVNVSVRDTHDDFIVGRTVLNDQMLYWPDASPVEFVSGRNGADFVQFQSAIATTLAYLFNAIEGPDAPEQEFWYRVTVNGEPWEGNYYKAVYWYEDGELMRQYVGGGQMVDGLVMLLPSQYVSIYPATYADVVFEQIQPDGWTLVRSDVDGDVVLGDAGLVREFVVEVAMTQWTNSVTFLSERA